MAAPLWLADRLALPRSIKAILFDMDGVLIDSIRLDYEICQDLFSCFVDSRTQLTRKMIREGFPLSPSDFWRWLLAETGVHYTEIQFNELLSEYETARRSATYVLNPGIVEILSAAKQNKLRMAVVSNNPNDDIELIVKGAGISDAFELIQGNDEQHLRKKPWPDTYLCAAERLGVDILDCAVIEDSMIGTEAGWRSGAYTISVATGGELYEVLADCGKAHVCYTSFAPNAVNISRGNVLRKTITTPNEFVSHMIEHIAWRLGASIDLRWHNNDWTGLGIALGEEIARNGEVSGSTAVLGMIDDGSCEVRLHIASSTHLMWEAVGEVSLEHFLSLRCEQLASGSPLKQLIEGLVEGLGADLTVRVCSLEDPHHTWEGIFRAIGVALSRLCRPVDSSGSTERWSQPTSVTTPAELLDNDRQGVGLLQILKSSTTACELRRETAESLVWAEISLADAPSCDAQFSVSDTINVSAFPALLACLADSSGLKISLQFTATLLSSSHVVLEDTALVIGTALFKIMESRMNSFGINGAGSSLRNVGEFESNIVAAAVSLEGRKFIKLIPFDISFVEFRRRFILGSNAWETLRTEDIDDFLDALAGGMRASIMLHFRRCQGSDSDFLWKSAMVAVGRALREAIQVNPYRKGLPPGVKATLI